MFGLNEDISISTWCRRAQLTCNGVDSCEYLDPTLFENCERFEPDEDARRELWNHELTANEREAGSVAGILSR